jgi:D-alanyl-D-alanine carboxypeptidase
MRRILFALLLSFPALLCAQERQPALAPPSARAAIETAFRARLAAQQQRLHCSGSCAAVALPDGSTVAVAIGADAAKVPLSTQSKLMSGSIGKTYCAAVALQLVHEQELALDGKVEDVLGTHDWYARVPNATSITLRHLLNHTSGIPEHVWKKDFQDAVRSAGDRALTPAECVAWILGDAPLFAPGTKWSYADTNYVLAGLCIEAATGKSYWTVLRERVLAPLELGETIANDRRELPLLACGLAGGIGFHEGPVVVDGKYFTNPVFEYCGGGISSTTRDLARWGRELFLGTVIPAELKAAHTDGVPADRAVGGRYGLGCFVTTSPHGPAFGHSGVMPGYLSYMLCYPELQLATAVQFPTDDGRTVGSMKNLLDELAGIAVELLAAGKSAAAK